MGTRLIIFLRKYKIDKILLWGFVINLVIAPLISLALSMFCSGIILKFNSLIIRLSLFLLWSGFSFAFLKSEYYKKQTGGRSLIRDQYTSDRTMIDLLQYYKTDESKELSIADTPFGKWTTLSGVMLGQKGNHTICHPLGRDGANFAVFASPGGGKTTGIIIPTCLRCTNASVFAIDIKGDISEYTRGKRRIKFFNPDDPNSSHFDPFSNIKMASHSDRILMIEKIAKILIPNNQKSSDSYFTQGAFDFFCGIFHYEYQKNPDINFPNFIKSIITGNAIDWVTIISKSKNNDAKTYLASYYNTNQKNVAGCYNQLVTIVRPLTTIGNLSTLLTPSEDEITPNDLENGTDVYLVVQESALAIYGSIMGLISDMFFSHFKSRQSSPKPIVMVLDELCQLNLTQEALTSALSTLRSRNISIVMAMQSISQLRAKYGRDAATTILDNCKYIAVMSATDPDSRDYFSRIFGTKKALKSTVGSRITEPTSLVTSGKTRSSSEFDEPYIKPEDFARLGNHVAILADGKRIIADKIKCWQEVIPMPDLKNQFHN